MGETIIFLLTWLAGIGAVVLLLYFISRHNLWFRKYGLTLFLGFLLLGFTVYFVGYFFGSEIQGSRLVHALASVFLSFFSSGRIMFMELDIGETGAAAANEIYRAVYGVVMFSTMVLLAVTVLTNVGGGVIGRIRLLFLRFAGTGHSVFLIYGTSRETVCLIEDIHRTDRRATILLLASRDEEQDREGRRGLENDAFRSGAFRIAFTPGRSKRFLFDIVKRCRARVHVICMHQERWKNVSLVRDICLAGAGKEGSGLQLYAVYDSEKSGRISQEDEFRRWEIHWVDPDELAARQMLMMPSFLQVCPEGGTNGRMDGELSLVVTGCSRTAEALCEYLISCVQTAGTSVTIRLFGEDIQKEMAYFIACNPGLSGVVTLIPMELEARSGEFYSFFQEKENRPDGIFCVDEDDRENRDLALQLKGLFQDGGREVPVFVRGSRMEEDRFVLEASGIICFGCMEQIYSYDVLIGEKLDSMAKAVHRFYSNFYGDQRSTEELWKSADIYDKMSSRAMAIHIPWKACCAGFEVVPGISDGGFVQELERCPELLENLAVGEHLRWEAVLFTKGWRSAPPDRLPAGRNKDAAHRLHACLVPWEALPGVGEFYQTDYQYLDRYLVKELEEILHDAGFSLKRRMRP